MTFFTLNFIHCCKRSSLYFSSNNSQRVIPDEYYLFSSDGYALAARWLLLWQRTITFQ